MNSAIDGGAGGRRRRECFEQESGTVPDPEPRGRYGSVAVSEAEEGGEANGVEVLRMDDGRAGLEGIA